LPEVITYSINSSNQEITIDGNTTASVSAPTSVAGTFTYSLVSVVYTTAPSCSQNISGNAVITVNALPTPTLGSTAINNTFCKGTNVIFTGGGGTGYNFRVGGVSKQNSSSDTYATALLENGQIVDVIVTNSFGCTATSSGRTNIVNALPVIIVTTAPTCTADLTSYSLGVTVSTGTVTSTSGTVTNTSVNVWTVSGIPSGTPVTVTLTDANSCDAIKVFTAPDCSCPVVQAPVSGGDKTYCASGVIPALTVTVPSGQTADWYGSDTGGSPLRSGSLSYTPAAAGTYYALARISASGCVSSTRTAVTLTMNSLPIVSISSSDTDNAFCSGTGVTFTAGSGTNYNFRVAGVSKQNSSSDTYSTSLLTNSQIVDVIVTNENGCPATSSGITNTVYALPAPTITSSDPDNIFCAGSSITFTATGGTSYNFRVGGASQQSGASATYTTTSLTNGQVVDVIVSNINGCTTTSGSITNFVNALPFTIISTTPTCSADLTTYSVGVTVNTGTLTSSAGTVINRGGNVWFVTGVPKGTNITIHVIDGSSCESLTSVIAPDCSCPSIAAPVSGGDKSYCASGIMPTMTASVSAGETVDWYNAATGGALMNAGSLSYTPAAAGVFYAMARNTTTGCTSSLRTMITVVMNALPVPTIASSDADNKYCYGTNVTFTATGGTNYNFRVSGVSTQSSSLATFNTSSLSNGAYIDVIVTNQSGCSATSAGIINTVNYLPSPVFYSSDSDNIFCAGTSITFTASGGTSYIFRVSGVSVQSGSAATYTTSTLTNGQVVDVIVSNENGCISVSSGLTNTVYALPVPTISSSDVDNIFCTGTSVTFTAGGGNYFDFTLNGQKVQSGAQNLFTTGTLTNGQVAGVIVTNSSGCTATASAITNTVNPYPVPNAGSGGNECDLNFRFSAIPSIGAGTWSKTTGTGTAIFSPDANTANAVVTVSEYGTYTFTWTEVSNSCSRSAAITVNFYQQPIAEAGTGGNNCGLQFSLKSVPSVGAGTWTKTSGADTAIFSPGAYSPTATVRVGSYGNYTFTWTEINGTCSAKDSLKVNFLQVPAANAGNDGSECDKDFVLNAVPGTGAGTGMWSILRGPGNAVFSPDPNKPDAKVTVDVFGAYKFSWTEINGVCLSTDSVSVVFRNLPAISAGNDTIICKGRTIQFKGVGEGTYLWAPDSLVTNPVVRNPVSVNDKTTTFNFTVTDQYGCRNTDSVLVEVWNDPVTNAGPDQVLEYLFRANVAASPPALNETGLWSVISGSADFSNSTSAETDITRLSPGKNILLWTVTNGVCPAVNDSLSILVNDLVVPTLITPNMDGRNDYFVLRGIETLRKTELVIFDRRGVQVYKNSTYDNLWDGVDSNGAPLPDDTYFFVIKAENSRSMSGYIVIRR
jgi:gliding motility-associated-like protein